MNLNDVLEIIITVLIISVLAVGLRITYSKPSVRRTIRRFLPILAPVFRLLGRKFKDKKGVFDLHDTAVVLSRVSHRLRTTLADPENKTFEDVQDDVFNIVNEELDRYRKAGVQGVPDVTDQALRAQVEIIFGEVQRIFSEDSTRNDSQD